MIDFLKQYGSISKAVLIDEPGLAFYNSSIVEYCSAVRLVNLCQISILIHATAERNRKLWSCLWFVQPKWVKGKLENCLSELQRVAKLIGQDFAVVITGVMSRLGQTVTELHSTAVKGPPEDSETSTSTFSCVSNLQRPSAGIPGHSIEFAAANLEIQATTEPESTGCCPT